MAETSSTIHGQSRGMGPGDEGLGNRTLAELDISWQSESVDLDILFDSLGADRDAGRQQTTGDDSSDNSGFIGGGSTVPMPISLDSLESLEVGDLAAIKSQVIADES